jgi:AAA+ ATPase superfamily predicted ATPase
MKKKLRNIVFIFVTIAVYINDGFGQQVCSDTSKITSCKLTIPNRKSAIFQKIPVLNKSKVENKKQTVINLSSKKSTTLKH